MPANKNAIARYRIIASTLEAASARNPVSIHELVLAVRVFTDQQVSVSTIEKDIHALRHDEALNIHAPIRAAPNGGFYLNDIIDSQKLNPFKTITMNLKAFNTLNTVSAGRSGQAVISISKAGVFTLSKPAAELLKVQEKDRIILQQDQDSPKDWYVMRDDEGDGFPLRQGYDAKGLMFNSAELRRVMLASLGKDATITKGVRLPMGNNPISGHIWPIMTAALNKH
ncbi:MAG: hypothetical protein Q8L89_04330 [Gammaproteobacteria bacterium]|nr:hypothetical protein [Gammaproteobacteria bacterium]